MLADKWNAKDYSVNSSAQEQWADELIRKLQLSGNESGLDIGCGDGKITDKISKLLVHGRMTGIDLSRSMVELAKETYASDNLSFYEMSATEIDLPDMYDFAFSNATLHWVRDHKPVLARLRKHLNSGAKILFQMGGHGNAEGIIAAFNDAMGKEKWRPFFGGFQFPYSFYDVNYYSELLPESGYIAERIELVEKIMKHASVRELKGWLRTTWFPYLERVEYEDRDTFLDEVVSTYLLKNPLDEDGTTSVKMIRLEVEARAL